VSKERRKQQSAHSEQVRATFDGYSAVKKKIDPSDRGRVEKRVWSSRHNERKGKGPSEQNEKGPWLRKSRK